MEHTPSTLSRDDIIERSLSTIVGLGDIQIGNVEDNSVRGVFYLPMRHLDKYVFADLVMNDPLFSSMLSIQEKDKATKEKGNQTYVHFVHPSVGMVGANLTSKVAVRGDENLHDKDITEGGAFALGSPYIRVRISKADNTNAVEQFKDILTKLFVVYDQNVDQIIADYQKFIPDFGKSPRISAPFGDGDFYVERDCT